MWWSDLRPKSNGGPIFDGAEIKSSLFQQNVLIGNSSQALNKDFVEGA